MLIYELGPDNYEERFLHAVVVRTKGDTRKCPECHVMIPTTYNPRRIRWYFDRYLPFTEEIADFTWPGGTSIMMVRDDVKPRMEVLLPGAEFHKVEIVPPDVPKKPSSKSIHRNNRLQLIQGLPLWQVTTRVTIEMDMAASGRKVIEVCATCGHTRYAVTPGAKFVIPSDELANATWFRLYESGGPFYVIDSLADRLASCHFTNLKIRKVGIVVELGRE